jgi:foldase protein PrsA
MKKIILIMILFVAACGARILASEYISILAKVGDEIITSLEVGQALKMFEAGMSAAEKRSPQGQKQLKEAREKILERMIEEKLVVLAAQKGPLEYRDAKDRGQAVPNPYLPTSLEVEEEMEKAFDEARLRFPTEENFATELAKERLTVPEFRNHLRDQMRRQLTFIRMINFKKKDFQMSIRISDEEAREYFDKNRSVFSTGDQVLLRQILFSSLERARQVATDISASSDVRQAFIKAAQEFSADESTRETGGRLGWIESGQLRWAVLEKTAFSLKAGRVSAPVKTEAGWHLLMVEETRKAKQKDFNEVKPAVQNALFQEKMDLRIREWLQSLKEEFYVEFKG